MAGEKKLTGKKILFFSPAFFAFESEIKAKMEEMGAEVDYFDERSITSSFHRALLKVSDVFFKKRTHVYYHGIFSSHRDRQYDEILFVKCDMADEEVLKECKQTFPHARMVLMLWDSMQNIKGIEGRIPYFDRILSFDRMDCLSHPDFIFRPDFYSEESRLADHAGKKYDICFVGTVHSDRYQIIQQVRKIAEQNNWKFYTHEYLQSESVYYFYKLTKPEFRDTRKDDFYYKKISFAEVAEKESRAFALLDIQHPSQSGLTLRAVNTLALHQKLITTNADIRNYDFYDPNNILIIDRNAVHIDPEFLNTPYQEVPEEIVSQYTLEQWILDVLGE